MGLPALAAHPGELDPRELAHVGHEVLGAHDSPGYQAALKVLGDAAERDLRIVEGVA